MFLIDYILTIRTPGGTVIERWDAETFNRWVAAQGEKIGINFTDRLNQFQRYTDSQVIDWTMEDR